MLFSIRPMTESSTSMRLSRAMPSSSSELKVISRTLSFLSWIALRRAASAAASSCLRLRSASAAISSGVSASSVVVTTTPWRLSSWCFFLTWSGGRRSL